MTAIRNVHDRLLVSPEIALADPFSTKRTLLRHFEGVSAAVGVAVQELRLQAGVTSEAIGWISRARERVSRELVFALDGTYDAMVMGAKSESALKGLSEGVIASVRNGFAGWMTSEERAHKLEQCLDECHTLNEITHVVHTYAMQNEEILEGLARWGVSSNAEGECVAVGAQTPFAREVFSVARTLFTTLESPRLFVFGHDAGVHLMLRDYGHATTVALTPDDKGKVVVHYFIPKILDERCLEALPGEVVHHKVRSTIGVAKGVFQIDVEHLAPALEQFIKLLPTDANHVPSGAFTVPWRY